MMMKKLIICLMLGLQLLLSSCSQKDITGLYVGDCKNLTYNLNAGLILNIKQKGDKISGTLSLTGKDLGGGGIILGNVIKNKISFTTPEDSNFKPIHWIGEIQGDRIDGIYIVEGKGFFAGKQEGKWSVKKEK